MLETELERLHEVLNINQKVKKINDQHLNKKVLRGGRKDFKLNMTLMKAASKLRARLNRIRTKYIKDHSKSALDLILGQKQLYITLKAPLKKNKNLSEHSNDPQNRIHYWSEEI